MENNIESIIEEVKNNAICGKEITVAGVPSIIIPGNCTLHGFEDRLSKPLRIKQKLTLDTPDSFINYCTKYGNEHSTIFFDHDKAIFTAIIDYHESADEPKHGDHTVIYECPKTEEWKRWTSKSGKKIGQLEFAEFIEENELDIVNPVGAEMLEIARTLQAKTNVDFKSGIRLDNGETKFTYSENINGSAGEKGELTIPSIIKLGIAPFEGGEKYEMEARFRYRINSGQLLMWVDLVRPHKVHDAAVTDVVKKIESQLKGMKLLYGRHQ